MPQSGLKKKTKKKKTMKKKKKPGSALNILEMVDGVFKTSDIFQSYSIWSGV